MSMLVTSLAEVWIETIRPSERDVYVWVTSLAEVWIETCIFLSSFSSLMVTSLAEVWIETGWDRMFWPNILSLPLRKCGLKQELSFVEWTKYSHFPCGSVDWNIQNRSVTTFIFVTSLAEVWIETIWELTNACGLLVTSLAEVWIETVH